MDVGNSVFEAMCIRDRSWEVRVVDNPEFINGLTEIFKTDNPKAAERPGFKNMFNNAPTVVFICLLYTSFSLGDFP